MNQSSDTSAFYAVQEFAELAGVSKQAVYERIKRDLKGYTIKQSGRTMISREALQFVGNKEESSESSGLMFELEEESSQPEQLERSENQSLEQESQSINQQNQAINQVNQANDLLEYLKKEVERLHGEIDRLNRMIAEKDAKISEFAERFAGIAEKEQEISSNALRTTGQAQMLHAMSEQPDAIEAPQEPQKAEKKHPWWKMKKN